MDEAETFLDQLSSAEMRSVAQVLHDCLLEGGASAYVKTIYVGYQIGHDMVGALYPHSDHVELALALDEHHRSRLLVDASHLTWRTMPVAALVRGKADLKEAIDLAKSAVGNVVSGEHNVYRDNEYFTRVRTERQETRTRGGDGKT